MEEQNQNWKDVIYEQVSEKENKPKKNKSKKMKHMKLVVGAAIAAGVLVPAVFGSFYQIQEQEQAVLVTFGKPKAVTETGLHFKLPFIQEVRKVNTTIQGFPVGYTEENNEMVEAESIMITSDYNFIDVDFFVEYRISDPVEDNLCHWYCKPDVWYPRQKQFPTSVSWSILHHKPRIWNL